MVEWTCALLVVYMLCRITAPPQYAIKEKAR